MHIAFHFFASALLHIPEEVVAIESAEKAALALGMLMAALDELVKARYQDAISAPPLDVWIMLNAARVWLLYLPRSDQRRVKLFVRLV